MNRSRRVLASVLLGMAWWFTGLTAAAQPSKPAKLQVGGVLPGGVQKYATDGWGLYDFNVTNTTDNDRQARVTMMFQGKPDVQYGRDLWVPAQALRNSWMLVGPATSDQDRRREIETQLYDRTDGEEQIIFARTEEKVRSRAVLFREREPFTVLMVEDDTYESGFGQLPAPEGRAAEALDLARTFRLARNLSEHVGSVSWRELPATAEAYDGISHFVLATNRLGRDPAGMRALRHWLERGGKIWVMLDQVEVATIAPLLGDTLDFQVVDRVNLTSLAVATRDLGFGAAQPQQQRHERPVDFVRVLLPSSEKKSEHAIQDWPIWFARSVGRGTVVLTTLGPRGWFRPRRAPPDPKSPFPNYPDQPVPLGHMELLAAALHPSPEKAAEVAKELQPLLDRIRRFMPEADDRVTSSTAKLQPVLAEEIGYAVISRTTATAVALGSFLAAFALAVFLRRTTWTTVAGLLGPAAAVAAAGFFLIVGESARRQAPATVAVAQIVEAVAGRNEAAVHGLLATYRPDSGTVALGAQRGGLFDLDMLGLEGRTRRFILTDIDAWHWDNLALPAGVRLAPFRFTLTTPEPLTAVVRYGPDGIEGEVHSGPFHDLTDGLINTPNGRLMAVRWQSDGRFRATNADLLPPGKFLADAVLSDRQLLRQEVFRAFLRRGVAQRLEVPVTFLAWAKPADAYFKFGPHARTAGDALLVLSPQFERAAAGARVTVPGPLATVRRLLGPQTTKLKLEGNQQAEQHVRFQLPAAVLPLRVERVRLTAKIAAPSRRVTISGYADGKTIEVHRVETPLDVLRLEITEERLLRLDDEGGLHLNVAFSPSLQARPNSAKSSDPEDGWRIEYLEAEVSGVVGNQ